MLSLTLVGAGLAVRMVAALVLGRGLRTLLYGGAPNDPATLVAAPLVLAAVCAVACVLPARRAARIDPTTALRAD